MKNRDDLFIYRCRDFNRSQIYAELLSLDRIAQEGIQYVYILLDKVNCIYIGRTGKLIDRISYHLKQEYGQKIYKLRLVSDKPEDIPSNVCDLENMLIETFKPRLNKRVDRSRILHKPVLIGRTLKCQRCFSKLRVYKSRYVRSGI